MNAERTASKLGLLGNCFAPRGLTTLLFAEINELVAQLAQRTDKTDALLSEIAKNVKDGKSSKMDPALSNEVKKLLGYGFSATLDSSLVLTQSCLYSGVQSGVEAHVSDFRGKLTTEVSRCFLLSFDTRELTTLTKHRFNACSKKYTHLPVMLSHTANEVVPCPQVGKLRDEKKTLQSEIAELMAVSPLRLFRIGTRTHSFGTS